MTNSNDGMSVSLQNTDSVQTNTSQQLPMQTDKGTRKVSMEMTPEDWQALERIKVTLPMGYQQLKYYLPHRYPFILIDRVTAYGSDVWIEGYKNVTINEPFFQGHFPDAPIMPGVLIVEAMAQLSGILSFISQGITAKDGYFFLLGGVDKVRFKNVVVPGDQLLLSATLTLQRKDVYKFSCKAHVGKKLTASAQVTLILQYHADKDKTKPIIIE